MTRTYAAIAVSTLALGAVAFTATEASAQLKPDPGSAQLEPGSACKTPEYNYPNYDPQYEVAPVETAMVPSDDNGVEALQAGAAGLGGAGVALGGLWLYRRRHAPAI